MSATAKDHLSDPELLETEWDLTPLVDGDADRGVQRQLGEARERAPRFVEPATPGPGRRARLRRTARRRCWELGGDQRAARPRRHLRLTALPDRYRRSGPRRAAPARAGARRPRSRPCCCSSSSSGRRSPTLGSTSCCGPPAWASAPTTCAALAAIDAPADRARGEDPRREVPVEPASWARLFGELTSALRVDLDGAEASLELALSRLQSPDRGQRRTAAEAVTVALAPGLRTRAFIFNTLVYEKSVDDRLRSYPHWLSSRNLSNEASDASVMALVEAVGAATTFPSGGTRLKARLLGIDRLADYDRAAPVPEEVTVLIRRRPRSGTQDLHGLHS